MKLFNNISVIFLVIFLVFASSVSAKAVSSSESEVAGAAMVQQDSQSGDTELYRGINKKAGRAREIIVAKVNGAEISMYDLVGMMNRVVKVYYPNVKEFSDEITKDVKKKALDRLIFEELAVMEAARQGINPQPEKVQEVIDNIRKAYETEEGYQKYLTERALTEELLKKRIERSMRLEGITGREIYQKVEVEPDVVQKVYDELKKEGKLRKIDELVVKEILVMQGESKEQTKSTAERLLKNLQANDYDFGKLVLDGTFIVRRLNVNQEKYPKIFEDVLKMETGEFSGVVEDGGSFHIFQVLTKDPARDLTEEEARGFIEDRMRPTFQENRRQEWVEELRKDAKIEIYLDDAEQKIRDEADSEEREASEEN